MPDNEREKNHKELLLKHDSKLTRKSSLRKPKENNNKDSFDDNFGQKNDMFVARDYDRNCFEAFEKDQLRKTVSFSGGETVREIQFDPAEFEEIPFRAPICTISDRYFYVLSCRDRFRAKNQVKKRKSKLFSWLKKVNFK